LGQGPSPSPATTRKKPHGEYSPEGGTLRKAIKKPRPPAGRLDWWPGNTLPTKGPVPLKGLKKGCKKDNGKKKQPRWGHWGGKQVPNGKPKERKKSGTPGIHIRFDSSPNHADGKKKENAYGSTSKNEVGQNAVAQVDVKKKKKRKARLGFSGWRRWPV